MEGVSDSNEKAYSDTGPRIKAFLKKIKLTQTDLAKRSGISRVALNRFLSGKSEIKSGALMRVFKALGVDIFGDNEK